MKTYDGTKFVSNPGSRIRPVRSAVVSDDGHLEVVKTGEEDLQQYINSFKDSCNINNIIARFAQGDESALNARQAMYGDFTEMPKTYAELLQTVINGRAMFDSLSSEQRQKFDNDFNKFFASAGSEEWIDKLGYKVSESTHVDTTVIDGDNSKTVELSGKDE